MRFSIVLAIIILLLQSQKTFSQTGCLSGNVIYNLTGYTLFGNPYYASFAYNTNAPNCPRAVITSSSKGSCYLSTRGFLGSQGTLHDYQILNPPLDCDIDDYVSALIISASAVGIFCLRRKNF